MRSKGGASLDKGHSTREGRRFDGKTPQDPQRHQDQNRNTHGFVQLVQLEFELEVFNDGHELTQPEQRNNKSGNQPMQQLGRRAIIIPDLRHVSRTGYHSPVLGIEAQGSAGASASPFCRSSMEMLSGERINAMRPSRGGRLIVTPAAINRPHRR